MPRIYIIFSKKPKLNTNKDTLPWMFLQTLSVAHLVVNYYIYIP